MLEHKIFKLHGNIDQKLRTLTFFEFKKTNEPSILISTDVCSRGLDFPEVTHSILLDPPTSITDYCNRVGRTARIDKYGVSLLILNNVEKGFIELLE